MAERKFDMSNYVDVSERIEKFYEKHPEGSLQSEVVPELSSDKRVCIRAYAYRSPDDTRPGIGTSWLEVPGRTPYTNGSEVENAETSAWGRAIASLGFEVKRGIASGQEVRSRQYTADPLDNAVDRIFGANGNATSNIANPNVCPVHNRPWQRKKGSNGGEFWACGTKDGDHWCPERPTAAWKAAHEVEA